MFTHPDTVVELATTRHLEVLAACERARLAARATASRPRQPGIVTTIRIWFGSVLIDLGTRLQGLTEAGRPVGAFGHPERMGMS